MTQTKRTQTKQLPVMLTAALGLASAALLGTSAVSANTQKQLTADEAKVITLRDAGLAETDVTALKVHPDQDNDRPVYEVEFKHGRTEYDYTVDAENGSITDKEIDTDGDSGTSGSNSSSQSAVARLTANEAKAIALRDAGLAEIDVTVLKVHPDQDNDRPVYEVEFKHGRTEYDYTIDATTGSITDKDID